eukprot:gene2804-1789_t
MQTINKHPVNVNPNARLHNTQQSNQPNLPTCKTVWNLHQINSRHQKFSSHKISPTQSVYHETSAPYVLHQQTLKTHVDSLLVPGSNLPRSLNHLQQTSLFKVARARVTANPQPKASTTRPTITTLHSIKAHKNQETHKNTLTARNPNNGPTATIGKPPAACATTRQFLRKTYTTQNYRQMPLALKTLSNNYLPRVPYLRLNCQ